MGDGDKVQRNETQHRAERDFPKGKNTKKSCKIRLFHLFSAKVFFHGTLVGNVILKFFF